MMSADGKSVARITGVAAAVVVAVSGGMMLTASTARADAVMEPIKAVHHGESTVIRFSGCDDPNRFTGMTMGIVGVDDQGGEWTDLLVVPPGATSFTVERPAGRYRAEFSCIGYNGVPTTATSRAFTVLAPGAPDPGPGQDLGSPVGDDDHVVLPPDHGAVAPPSGEPAGGGALGGGPSSPAVDSGDQGAAGRPAGGTASTGAPGLPSTGC